MRNELKELQITVGNIVEDEKRLRASVEFNGKERKLRNRLPEAYYIDAAQESTVTMIRPDSNHSFLLLLVPPPGMGEKSRQSPCQEVARLILTPIGEVR